MNPFHLARPVHDIELARDVYLNTLGCTEGLPGEQAAMFFADPSGNAIEIKALQNIATQLFAH